MHSCSRVVLPPAVRSTDSPLRAKVETSRTLAAVGQPALLLALAFCSPFSAALALSASGVPVPVKQHSTVNAATSCKRVQLSNVVLAVEVSMFAARLTLLVLHLVELLPFAGTVARRQNTASLALATWPSQQSGFP